MSDQEILAIAERVYRAHAGRSYPGRVDAARLAFAREIEKQVGNEIVSLQAQSDAWRELVIWACNGESTVDNQARQMYAEDLATGRAFDDWYDEAAGRETGYHLPPASILMIFRPYLLGKVRP